MLRESLLDQPTSSPYAMGGKPPLQERGQRHWHGPPWDRRHGQRQKHPRILGHYWRGTASEASSKILLSHARSSASLADARRVGQQRPHSWNHAVGPAVRSGTSAAVEEPPKFHPHAERSSCGDSRRWYMPLPVWRTSLLTEGAGSTPANRSAPKMVAVETGSDFKPLPAHFGAMNLNATRHH